MMAGSSRKKDVRDKGSSRGGGGEGGQGLV